MNSDQETQPNALDDQDIQERTSTKQHPLCTGRAKGWEAQNKTNPTD
jgi:hypothetical protein